MLCSVYYALCKLFNTGASEPLVSSFGVDIFVVKHGKIGCVCRGVLQTNKQTDRQIDKQIDKQANNSVRGIAGRSHVTV